METRTYHIEGMTCGGCTSSLEKRLLLEEGIETASASFETNSCEVTLDPAIVTMIALSRSPQRLDLNSREKPHEL